MTQTTETERYCVDSGRAVSLIPGDRCLVHGGRDTPCYTGLRRPRCQHPHLSPNHPYPHCAECMEKFVTTEKEKEKTA